MATLYQGPLRDQRPAAREALEMLLDDTARALVPEPRPCEVRRPVAILREIAGVTFALTNIAIEDGDIQFGTELLRRLVQELAAVRKKDGAVKTIDSDGSVERFR